ncbi:phosphonate ABC transporter, permease protein PhnE [Thermostichus vulcanus]|uniref:Phosphonate ABC transporter, permease protein PhnE n=1 Tax=Thermostichus vulcanus str. 'Rupite' TaxID=2813851 RepID=A0ABT0CEF2_THEVL|nr:phosphonate ABC transporter, permease protein PhnE [Thermostichus vulcanus]MCJ2544160.1 phosphonate ABC transporter, permease protein PhnE [Thermostichus vulcanus str. 'Rupite']
MYPSSALDEIRIPDPPAQVRWARRVLWMIGLTLLVLMALCLLNISVDWNRVASGLQRNLTPLLRGFSRPSGAVFNLAVQRMFESFNMAVVGTTIGGILSFPLSFLASSSLLGSGRLAIPGKAFLAGIRTFPELLLGIIFVSSFGPGQLAGIMAVGINSIGFLGKVFADIIEGIDPGPSEALLATGASPLHVFRYAVIPQVLPEFLSTVLYRFEVNLRSSATLGLVGAGGVGVLLVQRIQFRRWEEISTILLVIVAFVIVVDTLSSFLRKKLV